MRFSSGAVGRVLSDPPRKIFRLKPEATAERLKPEATAERLKPEATAGRLKPEATAERLKPEATAPTPRGGSKRTCPARRLVLSWALCLVLVSEAGATTILPAEFADVVNGSQLIVSGRVVDVRSEMTAGRRSIHSFVTVAVDQALKGSPGGTVVFRVPQGQVGRYRRIVVGAPEFSVGEEVMVFLTGRPPVVPTVFGLNQGVRRLRGDAATRRLALESYTRQVRAVVERAQ